MKKLPFQFYIIGRTFFGKPYFLGTEKCAHHIYTTIHIGLATNKDPVLAAGREEAPTLKDYSECPEIAVVSLTPWKLISLAIQCWWMELTNF